MLIGPELVFEFANENYQKLFKRSDLLGKPVLEVFPEIEDQPIYPLLRKAFDSGITQYKEEYPIDFAIEGGRSERLLFNFVYSPVKEESGRVTGLMVYAYNVTPLVQARKSLESNAIYLKSIIDSIPQMAWVTDEEGSHLYFNQRWYDYTGLTFQETCEWGWMSALHPDDREKTRNVWEAALATGSEYQLEYRFRRKDGVYRWFMGRASCFEDAGSGLRRWFGTCTDIHEQVVVKQRLEEAHHLLDQKVAERTQELQEANNHLRTVNEELNKFAYVISHDLKAPLRGINSLAEWIEQDYGPKLDKSGQEHLQLLRGRVKRMHNLIEGILQYSRASRALGDELNRVDLNQIVAEVIDHLHVPEGVSVEVDHSLPTVRCDEVKLFQLFQNLLGNALRFVNQEDGQIQVKATIQDGNHLISVRDNGVGIPPEQHHRIFELFQSLGSQNVMESTGVGLAISKKIVEFCGGKIWVESEPGKGATFYFTLPAESSRKND